MFWNLIISKSEKKYYKSSTTATGIFWAHKLGKKKAETWKHNWLFQHNFNHFKS